MTNETNTTGFPLEHLEDYAAGQREAIERAERERLRLRGGDPVKLREHDELTMGMRFGLAETLLMVSMKRRDAGNHQGALDAARLYAEQEYLARSTRDRLGR